MWRVCVLALMVLVGIFGCGGGGTSGSSSSLPAKEMAGIEIEPANNQLAVGGTLQFRAFGTYRDGSRIELTSGVVWNSSDPSVATISATGRASAQAAGTVTITASSEGKTGTTIVTVPSKRLVTLAISPASGTIASGSSTLLRAEGTYSDGSIQVVTAAASWSSGAPAVATIVEPGRVLGNAPGTATISAVLDGITATATVTVSSATLQSLAIVSDSSSLAVGSSQRYRAIGTYSDSTTQDLTAQVAWSSSAPSVAAIDASGRVSAASVGTTQISASLLDRSASARLDVTEALLVSLAVQPGAMTISAGTTRQWRAIGTFADSSTRDLTESVQWEVSDALVAAVDSHGVVDALAPGATKISATWRGVTGTAELGVDPADVSGIWQGTYTIYDDPRDPDQLGTYSFSFDLRQAGEDLTGTVTLRGIANGTLVGRVIGNRIEFSFTYFSPKYGVLMENAGSATIRDGAMSGSVLENFNGGYNCSYTLAVAR